MRVAGYLLLGAVLALAGHTLVGWLLGATPATTQTALAAPAPSPASQMLADARVDSPPFAAFPTKRVPDGTFIEVGGGVWFVAPSGFVATHPDARSLQLSVPGVNVIVTVSDASWLQAHGMKPSRDAIEAFAEHNHYQVLSMRDFGTGRVLANLSGSVDGAAEEITMMMHVQSQLRVSVVVLAWGARRGDPDVAVLIDESFHGRLFLP